MHRAYMYRTQGTLTPRACVSQDECHVTRICVLNTCSSFSRLSQNTTSRETYQSPPPRPPGACMPDTLESRRTKGGAPGYGGRNEGECGVPPHTGLHRSRTNPHGGWPRPPKGEVMSASKLLSRPNLLYVICYHVYTDTYRKFLAHPHTQDPLFKREPHVFT